MNSYQSVLKRYTSNQFRNAPVASVAKLMGLDAYLPYIKKHKAMLFPILCGLIVYRQLDQVHRMDVMRRIVNIPHQPGTQTAMLRSRLYGMAADIVANPSWFCWSLSDQELQEFFKQNKEMAEVLQDIGAPSLNQPLTAATLAGVLYTVSRKGLFGWVKSGVSATISSPKVAEAATTSGASTVTASAISGFAAVGFIMLGVLLVNAQSGEQQAKKELILRGLIRIKDL